MVDSQVLVGQTKRLGETSSSYDGILGQIDGLIDFLESANRVHDPANRPTPNAAASRYDSVSNGVKKHEKSIHQSLSKMAKAIDAGMPFTYTKREPLTFSLPEEAQLMNEAIAMHLLRQGHIDVVKMLISENQHLDADKLLVPQFEEMKKILNSLDAGEVGPALAWARQHQGPTPKRADDLVLALSIVEVLMMLPTSRPIPLQYDVSSVIKKARACFAGLGEHHYEQISDIMTYVVTSTWSYQPIQDMKIEDHMAAARSLFTSEYCGSLGISTEAPLLLAAYAGSIALPVIEKMRAVMKLRSAGWTSTDELPVSIDLPDGLHFHPIFVCPVSKEQTTNSTNPPLLLPCGHIISDNALKSLTAVNKRAFKCPYCPQSARTDELQRVFF